MSLAPTATAIVLGCGSSPGVPTLGTPPEIIAKMSPLDHRSRSSLWVYDETTSILIDTSPDLRMQGIREGMRHLDAVLFTHTHADHIFGIDDLRGINFWNGGRKIQLHAVAKDMQYLTTTFKYIFEVDPKAMGPLPQVSTHEFIAHEKMTIGAFEVLPVVIDHGNEQIIGFRIGNMAYLTDCSGVEQKTTNDLAGIETLIVGALREEPHSKHYCVADAVALGEQIGARRTILTHMSGSLAYKKLKERLAPHAEPAHDGLRFNFSPIIEM